MADLSGESTFAIGMQSRRDGNPTFGIPVGGSPFTYAAPYPMAVAVSGGAVSLIQYRRGGALTAIGMVAGLIELNAGDSVVVTWAITPPSMTAIPR